MMQIACPGMPIECQSKSEIVAALLLLQSMPCSLHCKLHAMQRKAARIFVLSSSHTNDNLEHAYVCHMQQLFEGL